MYKRRIGKY